MSQNSEIIYKKIESKNDLEKFIIEKTEENLYLEFKEKANSSTSELSITDKKNFSESLSQFANSDGGVLIFGIRTSKPNDYASKLMPIKDVNIFLSRLWDYSLHAVQPSIDGIEAKIIEHDSNSGFIVFHVPASFKTPHRAMASREYLKRGQTGKHKMEHFDLEDMFGRRQKPLLTAEIRPVSLVDTSKLREDVNATGYFEPLQYNLMIYNTGRYIAKNTMLVLEMPNEEVAKVDISPVKGAEVLKISDLRLGKPTSQVTLQKIIFYPNISTKVATLDLRLAIRDHNNIEDIFFNWELYAEDMFSQFGKIIFKK